MKQLKKDFKIEFYDEYQRLQRYRNGYVLFVFLTIALIFNGVFEIQWGTTPYVEMSLIGIGAFTLHTLVSVFTHSYFKKKENIKTALVWSIITGLLYAFMSWDGYKRNSSEFYHNGKVGREMFFVILSMNFLLIPPVMGIRVLLEKIKEKKE